MENQNTPILVLSSFPDLPTARQIGTLLVEKQYAACVSLLPSSTSIYSWQGKIETSCETLALIKTTTQQYPALEKEILHHHPYDVPEILCLPTQGGSSEYIQWLLLSARNHGETHGDLL